MSDTDQSGASQYSEDKHELVILPTQREKAGVLLKRLRPGVSRLTGYRERRLRFG